MPPKHKTEQEKSQTRTAILNAARDLFVARGVEAVTMREIARQVNYSPTALYLHFADKETLLKELCSTDFLALADGVHAIMQIDDPVERLNVMGRSYAEFALNHPNHYRLLFMTPQIPCDAKDGLVEKGNPDQDTYAMLMTMVNLAYEAGCFREELKEPSLIAQTLWAGMHGVCALEIAKQGDPWVDWQPVLTRILMMQDALMRGLLRQPR
ncbi:MAG: TetR/AcrR family transcriptional regulator [Methylophilaceae bacterium]